MSRRWLLLFVALLLLTVVVRLPAGWAVSALPAGIECAQPQGTIWRGGCGVLRRGALQLGPVQWQWQPWRILRGELAAQLRSADPRLQGQLQLARSFGGQLSLREIRLSAVLDDSLLPAVAANWSGSLQLALPHLRLQGYRLLGIEGVITVQQLRQRRPALEFGSYELRFPASADSSRSVGQLRDLSGPLSVAGTLSVDGNRQYEVDGTVLARADVAPELLRVIEILGPPDSSGRRPFSLAGVY